MPSFMCCVAAVIWRLLPHDFPPMEDSLLLLATCGVWMGPGRSFINTFGKPFAGKWDARRNRVRASSTASRLKRRRSVVIAGYDGAKKVQGRKRHLLVDTVGLVLKVKVHRADIQDSDGVPLLLTGLEGVFPRLQLVWVDGGYRQSAQDWITQHLGWSVQVVKHPRKPRGVWAAPDMVIDWDALLPKGFRGVLPRRWVVERTFAWLSFNRRLSRDYERLPDTSEAFIYLAMARLMARRLARSP